MTLQQLKYIVAINRYRNFAKAADACGISQPTLSAMLVKLEEELDVRIFERSNKNVTPTIAPYVLPKFIRHYIEAYPQVKLSIREMKADVMLSELQLGHLDAGIAIAGNSRQGILEVPLYTEKFMVYLAEDCWRKLPVFKPENLEHEKMWIMEEAQCLREADCEVRGKALNAVLSAMEIGRDKFFDFLGITLDVFAKRYIVESP